MKPKPGRRPGDSDITRQAILTAARERFGAVGFDRATMRAIATSAEVDPALIHHHFTNKHQLFVAAHELPVDPAELFGSVAELPLAQRGEALVGGYLAMFTQPGSPALSMLRAAATNENAAAMLREFLNETMIELNPGMVEGPAHELRTALIGSHLIGLVFARELIGIEPLRSADVEQLVEIVAPVVQRYIEQPIPEIGRPRSS